MGILFQYLQIGSAWEDLGTQTRPSLDGKCLVHSRKEEDETQELEEIRAFQVLCFRLVFAHLHSRGQHHPHFLM